VRQDREKLLTLCAWCGAVIVDAPPGPNGEISHGICPVCESSFDEELDKKAVDLDYEIARRALS
jgi:hypothetical protein